MKKRIISIFLVLVLLCMPAFAAARASYYLSNYGGVISAEGNGLMALSYSVTGTGYMDVVGVQKIAVEQKVGSNYYPYQTFTVDDYPEFYAYNKLNKTGTFYFTGIPTTTYRVVLTAYAEKDGGWDTGEITITGKVCQ